jgi:hypothetical protein
MSWPGLRKLRKRARKARRHWKRMSRPEQEWVAAAVFVILAAMVLFIILMLSHRMR